MKNLKKEIYETKIPLGSLPDYIAEYNKDGKYEHTAWEFYFWLKRKIERNFRK